MNHVSVIGGGLAGSEAAWQLARQGTAVTLYEMRPKLTTGAHHTALLAELVCSNSLRAAGLSNAVGLLKEEMRQLGSLVMQAAEATLVPAGGAMAVDRTEFAEYVTRALESHPLVTVCRQEITELPQCGVVIVASGPLTSAALAECLRQELESPYLAFFDAAAPIVLADSINWDHAFLASRYGKGEAAYINCPLSEEEYDEFYGALISAERQQLKDVDAAACFEGCMPIESMADRGRDTLLFGPLKPVGLVDPKTGRRPFAVVQLRQDNRAATLYNLVGFQTRLTWREQQRVFSLIPALKKAEYVRYGVMHRNTFIDSRAVLLPTLQWRQDKRVLFAGQITGVEGYVESAACGLVAGINGYRLVQGMEPLVLPTATAHGALINYITEPSPSPLQPMNVTFGLFPPLAAPPRDRKLRNLAYSERALRELTEFFRKLSPDCLCG
ncbi:MAG: methylenetetrahydrofolate--tRNA-(uracil(54)-C(5))-methyltransferase (FADH(2)-oxidizing) TrmFO [Selenomonadales bacterium]|nr:methylenetetrahydrofolate--tRNA-(uracil(54)-C(5))-methyltransferase (FADH(2)-oxidizing) TrmFO [Selenomonadales bacterium]